MKTVYREKRYYCGEYLDVYIYPTYRQGRSRGKRSKPTSAAQAKLNQRHREEKLVRLLHANFTPDDLEIHLTYQQQPESPEEAQRLYGIISAGYREHGKNKDSRRSST